MNQLFSTILNELVYGYLVGKKLPYISLNFNKKSLLYSIQNEYYKHTLIGNIITLLDYYMKCYINGGFFKEEFIYEWHKNRNTDRKYLKSNLILFHKYLMEYFGDINKFEYYTIDEFINDNKIREEHKFKSAFRIIGKLRSKIDTYKDVLIPDFDYDVQSDLYPFPSLKNDANAIKELERAIEITRKLIYINMEKVPYFQPYFELLRIITFCIHYLPNIQECGLFPDLSDSIQNKYPGIPYVKNVPPVFPQLPISNKLNIEIDVHFKDILKLMNENEIKYINKVISDSYLEKMENNEQYNQILFNILDKAYREKIKEKLGKENEYLLMYFNLKRKGFDKMKNMFLDMLNYLIYEKLKSGYLDLFKTVKTYKFIFGEISNNYDLEKLKTMNTLKKIENFINDFVSMIYVSLDSSDEKMRDEKNKIVEKVKESGKNEINKQINIMVSEQRKLLYEKLKNTLRVNNILNDPKNKDLLKTNKQKIEDNINNQVNKKIESIEIKFTEEKSKILYEIEQNINKLSNNLIEISNKLKNYNLLNKNENYDSNYYFKYKMNFPKIDFDSDINLDNINTKYIGGCLIGINNDIILNNIIMNNETYQIIKQNNQMNFNYENKFYVIKSKLKQGFAYSELALINSFKIVDKNQNEIGNLLNRK